MLECLVYLIIWVIVALIVVYAIETVLRAFSIALPPPILILIRLLIALLVVIAALNCLGLLHTDMPMFRRPG